MHRNALSAVLTLAGLGTACTDAAQQAGLDDAATRGVPHILVAEAGCEEDHRASAWTFEAVVLDADGPEDVVEVYAQVVDAIGLVDTVRLERAAGDRELWLGTWRDEGPEGLARCATELDVIFHAVDGDGDKEWVQIAHVP